MAVKIAILQSSYIPWKGYFDIINKADILVLYDDMQYTKRDWRNRNRIQTDYGLQWLSIPVIVKGKYLQKIRETKIADPNWSKKHWSKIKQSYSKSDYFKDYRDIFENIYMNSDDIYLSKINYKFINAIMNILDIQTEIRWSSEFVLNGNQTEKLIRICKDCNADTYISGPSAKDYFDEGLAKKSNIHVEWMDYNNYQEYHQLHEPFSHQVTILDLIFNEGPNAKKIMKNFKECHAKKIWISKTFK
jgi:hypothetical protein